MSSDGELSWRAYVGSRTTRERGARGSGISVFAVDGAARNWRLVQTVEGLVNPSYLALDAAGRRLYAVHGDTTLASAFAIAPGTGALTLLNQVETGGLNPVHLALDPSGRFLIVANHLASHVVSIALTPDGALGAITDTLPLPGEAGPHRREQPFGKPHQVVFDRSGRFLLVPDKGLDKVFVLSLDPVTGRLAIVCEASEREGSGPRHAVFSLCNHFVYVVNELDSTVSAWRFDAATGAVHPLQRLSALPDAFFSFSRAAAIVISPDGRSLYATNRGHDSIAQFAVDPDDGRLEFMGASSSCGATPRFCCLGPNGSALIWANEDSDTIMWRALRDTAEGTMVVSTGSPVCVLFSTLDT